MITRDKIKRIGQENPDLDADGFRVEGQEQSENDFRHPSEQILAEIEEAHRYLTRCEKVDRFNLYVTTDTLKNYATEFSCLDGKRIGIRNGCLIVAAMIAGFAVKPLNRTRRDAILTIGFHALPPGYWSPLGRVHRRRRPKVRV